MPWFIGLVAIGVLVWFFWPTLAAIPAALALGLAGMFTLFAVGTGLFWILLLAESALLCFYLLDDSDDRKGVGFGATVSLVVTIALLSVFGNFLTFLWENLLVFGYCVVGYLVSGVLYSAFRIRRFSSEADDAHKALVSKFLAENKLSEHQLLTNPSKKQEMKAYVRRYARYGSPLNRIREEDGRVWLSDHKARIMTWLMYWPWSFAWYLLHDLVREIFEEIYRLAITQFQRIADHATKDTSKYYAPDPPQDPPSGSTDSDAHVNPKVTPIRRD